MKHSTEYVLQEILEKLGFHIDLKTNLCEVLNHRELFYLHLEICLYAHQYMPYEYIVSLELIDAWLNDAVNIEESLASNL